MRLLIVHNRYTQRGGEDTAVDEHERLFASQGHAVEVWKVESAEVRGVVAQLRAAAGAPFSRWAAREMRERISRFSPDIVHVHNTWPLLSPSVHDACRRSGVPSLQTLHNYRLLCASADLHRAGRQCTDCVGRTFPLPAIRNRCYRGSVTASTLVAATQTVQSALALWQRNVTLFVAPAESIRQTFIGAGFDAARITTVPNALASDLRPSSERDGPGIFLGRLTEPKGAHVLLAALARMPKSGFDFVGGGPLAQAVSDSAARHPGLRFFGELGREEALARLARASYLVVPSLWSEVCPMVVIEAMALGVAVIASNSAPLAELIDDGHTGLLVGPGDAEALARAMRTLDDNPEQARALGAAGRVKYLRSHSPAAGYAALSKVYSGLLRG